MNYKLLIVGVLLSVVTVFMFSIDCKAPYYKNIIIGYMWCKPMVQVGINYDWVNGK